MPNNFLTVNSSIDLSDISIVDSSFNYSGNYANYVSNVIASIAMIKQKIGNLKNSESSKFNESTNLLNSNNQKQILLLDLDETLIHSDFGHVLSNYDAVIKFKVDSNNNKTKAENGLNDNQNFVEYSVGIFVRTGLYDFLENLYEKFDIYIFTASVKEYADAVIDYIDPKKKYIKKRFYRNDCVNIGNKIFIKDLSILNYKSDCNSSNLIIVDNSLYSFMNNISNGILINSFYFDKNDYELYNVMNYLLQFIYNSKDVKEVNDKIFRFRGIMNEIENDLNAGIVVK